MNHHEIENVSSLSPKNRYDYFIRKIADFEEVWTIIDSDGNFTLAEVEHNTVISLWTAEGFIESNLTPDWADCVPFKLSLDALEEVLIPLIRQNNYLINIFPVNSRIGHIVTLNDFINDLNDELEQYE
ncbi:hypothetical protein AMR72_16185 [Flavobacterium psychrophilum]|nr:hypothetical protein AMR72_16185 [Flavobacterium psychrophilum]AOE53905.1 hypothetical protein ALW18_16175 [Flavobacterium psychrophilum]